MTNGEKMQEAFPEGKTRKCRDGVVFESDGWCHAYDSDWWNAEYKEPTTRNCFGCKYSKDNHNAGTEKCHLCMWENQYTPTTKNDLDVDCISRADVIRAIEDVLQSDNCDYDLIEFLADLKDMPSVTPQEPRKGHWIKGYTFPDGEYWKCDKCNELIKVKYPMHYCNNCGSDNREVEE